MNYARSLSFPITPKSGPVPPMQTLQDASRAITAFLPRELMRQRHWLRAGWAVRQAAQAPDPAEPLILEATEALVSALDIEGWMSVHDMRRRATAAE
jgi:hypothetical protein